MKNDIPVAGCAHQAGTCRFGTDPADSVLDADCKAHEVDNLYVVDTSFFPSISAVNPALTAMANAIRVGDHLLERDSAGERRVDGHVRSKSTIAMSMTIARLDASSISRGSSSRRRRCTTSCSCR